MPDNIARKRLKKKMLDRWENEGGRVCTEPTSGDKDGPTNDHPGEGKQVSSSSDNSTSRIPALPTKRNKRTRK
jgi:hypothetical protein